jgi:RNA polymerase sigma-70 factor (ECF subfamily)
MTSETRDDLLERARFGDREAFDALVSEELPRLRGVVRRMVGHPEDTEDLVQESLLRALEKLGSFRGESAFGTWLVAIGVRAALDHLRARKRWRPDAQVHVRAHLHSTPAREAPLMAVFQSPEHRFDAREHIAFCFTCVSRSLPPEQQAALVLRDVLAHSNREAARMVGVSESVLRHRLAAARAAMQEGFDGLCGLVSKQGVCYQCAGLREAAAMGVDGVAAAERRGPEIPTLGGQGAAPDEAYERRLEVVRGAEIDAGRTQALHDLVWRALERIEQEAGAPGTGAAGRRQI